MVRGAYGVKKNELSTNKFILFFFRNIITKEIGRKYKIYTIRIVLRECSGVIRLGFGGDGVGKRFERFSLTLSQNGNTNKRFLYVNTLPTYLGINEKRKTSRNDYFLLRSLPPRKVREYSIK